MGTATDRLILESLVPESGAERSFDTTGTTVTLGVGLVPTDPGQRFRFVRIQAHDGDLMVELGYADNPNMRAAAPNGGSIRVRNGTETLQLPAGGLRPEVAIKAVTGTVHGAVLWGH